MKNLELKNKIYKKDVIKGIKSLDDLSVDLVISDPPYNISIDRWDMFKTKQKYFKFIEEYLTPLFIKIKLGGTIYLYNNEYNSALIIPLMEKLGYKFVQWITWVKKDGFSPSKRKYVNNKEIITMFVKPGSPHKFNYDEIRIPYDSTERMKHAEKKGILKNNERWFPNKNGKLATNVWMDKSHRQTNKKNGKTIKFVHPTMKPEEQIKRMILASSDEKDLILDLFSGSGTTSYIAKQTNRNSIGFERNEEYIKYAKKRLSK